MELIKRFLNSKLAVLFIFLTYGYGQTNVSGFISSNTTWGALSSPYVVTGSVLINEGVTLTIEAGVEVKFDAGNSILVNGELIAQGTDGNEITFTSNETSPAAGDWGQLKFSESSVDASFSNGEYVSGSILEYCVIEYGAGLDISNAGPFIYYSELRYNSDYAITIMNNDYENSVFF